MGVARVTDFVRHLLSMRPEEFGPSTVGRLLADVSFGTDEVDPYCSFKPKTYTRNLIFRNEDFEVAVMCWDAAATTPIHDHGGQQCWMTAIRGTFDVQNYERIIGGWREGVAGLAHVDTSSAIRRGEPDYRFRENDIHRVCVSPREESAVSLHVYAKPLTSCLIYDLETKSCAQTALDYDTVAVDEFSLMSLNRPKAKEKVF